MPTAHAHPGMMLASVPEYGILEPDHKSAVDSLEIQLKVHLLTTTNIFIPGGHFFDSAALWYAFKKHRDLEATLLQPIYTGGAKGQSPTLTISRHGGASDSLDQRLRLWLFGANGKRVNYPSATGTQWIPGLLPKGKARALIDSWREAGRPIEFEEYVKVLKLEVLGRSKPDIDRLMSQATVVPVAEDRHDAFRATSARWLAARMAIRGPGSPSRAEERVLERIEDKLQPFNRSTLRDESVIRNDSEVWPALIALRETCYLPSDVRMALPVDVGSGNDEFADVIECLLSGEQVERWQLDLAKLSFTDIALIRQDPAFGRALYTMSQFDSNISLSAVLAHLRGEWKQTLLQAAAKSKATERQSSDGHKEAVKRASDLGAELLKWGAAGAAGAGGVAASKVALGASAAVLGAAGATAMAVTLAGVGAYVTLKRGPKYRKAKSFATAVMAAAQRTAKQRRSEAGV